MLSGRIYLIGMPGSGKSFFAQQLSDHFSYPQVDLDHEIEQQEGISIPELFESRGEAYFRKMEAELLRNLTSEHQNLIISTGGGTPCFHDSMEYMNTHGTTVFLKTKRELIIERLLGKSDRPLMQGDDVAEKVDQLLTTRTPIYQKARITITHRDPDLLAAQIENI